MSVTSVVNAKEDECNTMGVLSKSINQSEILYEFFIINQ